MKNNDGGGCCHTAAIFLRSVLLIAVSTAFFLSCMAARSCQFLQYQSGKNDSSGGYAGLFSYRYGRDEECIPYDGGLDVDGATQTARTGAIAAPILGFLALLLATVELLCGNTCLCRHLAPSLLIVATLMQGLTFLLLTGAAFCDVDTMRDFFEEAVYDRTCTMSSGSWRSLFALLFLSASSILYWIAPVPTEALCAAWGTKTNKSSERTEEQQLYSGAAVRTRNVGVQPEMDIFDGEDDIEEGDGAQCEQDESLAHFVNDSSTLATEEGEESPVSNPRQQLARPQRRSFDPAVFRGGRPAENSDPVTGTAVYLNWTGRRSDDTDDSLQDGDLDESVERSSARGWVDEESLAGYSLPSDVPET